jgi:hypothetical protein
LVAWWLVAWSHLIIIQMCYKDIKRFMLNQVRYSAHKNVLFNVGVNMTYYIILTLFSF